MSNVTEKDLQELCDFLHFGYKVNATERKLRLPVLHRAENDAEHIFQLSLVAWYLIQRHKLKLNQERVFHYCLAHDLVEAYSGDLAYFEKSPDHVTKHERELAAATRIKQEFPHFDVFWETWHNYENKVDDEAKFIYALDKLLPTLNTYLDGGHNWKAWGVDQSQIFAAKTGKVDVSPIPGQYFQLLNTRLIKVADHLFSKP